jgi:predicted hydrolase (HD superfamily)
MLAVEAAMKCYAKKFHENETYWGNVGLLHDFDYEKYPEPKDHPYKGVEILKKERYSDEFTEAILAHSAHTGISLDTALKKTIFAVDELCGFIVAVALVKPHKILSEVEIKSIKKKLKDKAFAKTVKRVEIYKGAEILGQTIDEHIGNVLAGMKNIANDLGL